MNKQESDIINALINKPYTNQRILAKESGHSLGIVNRSIKTLINDEYLNENMELTQKAKKEIEKKAPRNAIILAAGFGMRMVPINTEVPKGLLEIQGEPLIERQIKQLHKVGIREIYIVVGFMKEQYEYLIDKYNVELVVNKDYALKNNLHSMKLVLQHLSNTYIIPCDIWSEKNPFHRHELYSWYMVSDIVDNESSVRVNRKMELILTSNNVGGNEMMGISYLLEEQAAVVRERICQLCMDKRFDGAFWEEALYQQNKMLVQAWVVHAADVIEINTYEQLRELDSDSNQLKSEIITLIAKTLNISNNEITDIEVLKKGMTNRSFLFNGREEKYIMRIPGEGTDYLINRGQEAEVYRALEGYGICDDIVYFDAKTGYKITKYFEGARVCDPFQEDEIDRCMKKLREFHNLNLQVEHEFDIFRQIQFYENLWKGASSIYRDYKETKKKVFSLRFYIEENIERKVLTHMDAVPDNFLFIDEKKEEIRIIDWEYAGMQDPHVDIAMFCVYAMYNKKQVDRLIQAYFSQGCPNHTRIKIYCYISACGLLWSNWCEYKRSLGVEFGEYSLRQYRFAKDYYRIVQEEFLKMKEEQNESGKTCNYFNV
ncbi:MAG: NTP transferase domain-containing protein [Lachnospiraceae bacterium]|nr:NTP transferase domain-containing protein [Lachnospiraceae bacterium]